MSEHSRTSSESSGRSSPSSERIAAIDETFVRKLDRFGAYHRFAAALVTMLVTFAIVPQPAALLWVAALYLGLAGSVLTLLSRAGSAEGRSRVRIVVMLIDIALVTIFAYRWGARTSPAAFMYVPVVSGWTLIPQRHIGRLAGVLALAAYGSLLAADSYGLLPRAPDLSRGEWIGVGSSGLLYFGMLACAISAVHGLVYFTVEALREHSQVVTRLTVEKRERERAAQLASQLEEAQRLEALGRLAGGVAHDMNNLLTVVIGCAELAEQALERTPAQARRALDDLQAAAERGGTLAAQLLDFASRRFASPADIDANEVLRGVTQLLPHLLPPTVALHIQPCSEPCMVHLDPGGLERILLNLAVNAGDAMPRGGSLHIALSIVHEERGEQVLIEVRDTGLGIAARDLPRIFEPFFTTKPRGKGTGLGLASVYGIVKQHGGQIEVDSEENAGTTFRVRFPRVFAEPTTRPATLPPAPHLPGSILLVDDDPRVRDVLLAHLESAGYTVLAAGSSEEAIALLEHNGASFDMLVSDVSMPGLSGVELARRAKLARPSLPILLISGYAAELEDTAAGLARFLSKPFTRKSLLLEVARALAEPRG